MANTRLWWFLHILQACGGTASASDDPGEWVAAFCVGAESLEREPDTFNWAADQGYTRVTYDSDMSTSTVYLTDKGRALLAAVPATPAPIGAVAWRSMDSAPRQRGKEILLRRTYREDGWISHHVARWWDGDDKRPGLWQWSDGAYRPGEDSSGYDLVWLPIPAATPPNAVEPQGDGQ